MPYALFMFKYCAFLIILTMSTPALAHHPGHGGSSGTRSVFYQGRQTKPQSLVYFSGDFQYEDNSVGELTTFALGGEWAINKKISLLGQLPFSYLSHNFTSNTLGLGDISLGGKYAFSTNKPLLFATLNLELPTGNDSKGLGQGDIASQVGFFIGVPLAQWTLFFNPSTHFAWSATSEPTLNLVSGFLSPDFFQEKINFGFSVIGQIYLDSDTFSSGSSKWSLEPQINWILDSQKKITLSQSVRLTFIDDYTLKNGVNLTATSHSLLNDVLWGLTTTLSYSFK